MAKGIPQERLESLNRLLGGARSAVIAVHTHPDGDAVGSAVALGRFLSEKRGIDACILLPDPAPAAVNFLLEGEAVVADGAEAAARIASAGLVFCLDCNGFSRTAALETPLREARCPKVLIDHHLNPVCGEFDLVFSETAASSASELLYHILTALPDVGSAARLPRRSATALMTGMTTDTNNFANSATPATFRMAADLIEAGVDREAILQQIYRQYDERRLRLLAYCLDTMTLTPEGAAYIILSRSVQQRFGVEEGDTEGFVNEPLAIGRVRISLFLKEEDDLFRVSVRAKRGTSAQRLASTWFHGGGHELASGGKIFFPQDIATPGDAPAYLENILRQYLSE